MASQNCLPPAQYCSEVGQSSEHEDDKVDISIPDQVHDRMLGRLDIVGHRVLERGSLDEPS